MEGIINEQEEGEENNDYYIFMCCSTAYHRFCIPVYHKRDF
jgi:hypothetical protein